MSVTDLPDLLYPHINRAMTIYNLNKLRGYLSAPTPCPICGVDGYVGCFYRSDESTVERQRHALRRERSRVWTDGRQSPAALYEHLTRAAAAAVWAQIHNTPADFRALFVPCLVSSCAAAVSEPCIDSWHVRANQVRPRPHVGRLHRLDEYVTTLRDILPAGHSDAVLDSYATVNP